VLTIEGDQPGMTDERTRIRIQAFVELLEARQ
jgi:benzoyl-CoA reductase/2-hydroxyglutaryl-CoA dehydratase subunit BcrC/BadD/HgdB